MERALARLKRLDIRIRLSLESSAGSLFPHRAKFVVLSFGVFAAVAFSIGRAVEQGTGLPPHFTVVFGASVPLVIWPLGLLLLAVWFHPRQGLLVEESRWFSTLPQGARAFLRGYATFSLLCFLLAPVFVLLSA